MEEETENFDNEIVAYLSTRKQKLIDSHNSYILEHPEMRQILNDFMSSVLITKPDDVYLFAKEYFHPFNPTPVKDKPFIVCGPFGVGKGTLRKRVLGKYGDLFDHCISHTTREKKADEAEGAYHYVTNDVFERMKKDGKFFETCESWGHQYGTSKQEIQRIKDEGKIPYIEVNFKGANGLKSIAANFVYLYPPDIEELRRRIANRTEDTEELFKMRIELAIKEIEMANNSVLFTNHIINDELEKADQQLCTLIEALYFQELKDRRGEEYEKPPTDLNTLADPVRTKSDIAELQNEIDEHKAKAEEPTASPAEGRKDEAAS